MFTARYGLIPYIKQITFRLQKFNYVLNVKELYEALSMDFKCY